MNRIMTVMTAAAVIAAATVTSTQDVPLKDLMPC